MTVQRRSLRKGGTLPGRAAAGLDREIIWNLDLYAALDAEYVHQRIEDSWSGAAL